MTRLERAGLAVALTAMLLILTEACLPAAWPLRACVVAFGVAVALVADPWRRP